MKILYITYDGLTDFIGQSQVLPYLLGTARRGHKLTVVSFEKDERLRAAGGRVAADCAEAGIDWRPQKFHSRPPYLAKFIDQRTMRRVAMDAAARGDFEIVHCRSYPAAVAGLAIKRRFGTRLLFDMRGFWPDSRREGGRWGDDKLIGRYLYRHWKRQEATLIGSADHIVALTDAAHDEIERWPGYRGAPISVVPCCADFSIYRPTNDEQQLATRKDLGFGRDDPILLYVGSLGTIYRLNDLLRLFDAIRQREAASRLLIIGRNSTEEIMQAAAAAGIALEPGDFRILSAERAEVARWISIGDAAACFYTPTYSSKHVSPTKLAEYLACGVPVIANRGVGDVEAILADVDGGHVLPDFSDASIGAAAQAFFDLRRGDHATLRERASALLDLDHAVDAYDNIYRDLRTAVRVGQE